MLLKVSLILGVEIHVNVEFVKLLEPPEEQNEDGKICSVPVIWSLRCWSTRPVWHYLPVTVADVQRLAFLS